MVKRSTEIDSEILATGQATLSQIAQMFRTDAKTLPSRLRSVVPAGKRNGYKVYDIRDAASFIVTPGYEIEDFIRQMSPQELPPLLQKEFWNGQRARTAYEKEIGNLWPTEDVVALMAVLEGGIRQTLLLITDDIEREDGLTDGQRKTFRRIADASINMFKEKLTEAFQEYHATRDNHSRVRVKPLGSERGSPRSVPDSEDNEEVDI